MCKWNNNKCRTVMVSTVWNFIFPEKQQRAFCFLLDFLNRLHPWRHIVRLLHPDIYIRKVIFELPLQLCDENDDGAVLITLVFVLRRINVRDSISFLLCLTCRNILPIILNKSKQRLMPENRQFSCIRTKSSTKKACSRFERYVYCTWWNDER